MSKVSRITELLEQDGLLWLKHWELDGVWVAHVRLDHTQGMRQRGQVATLCGRPVDLVVRRSFVVVQSTDARPPALSVGDEVSWEPRQGEGPAL